MTKRQAQKKVAKAKESAKTQPVLGFAVWWTIHSREFDRPTLEKHLTNSIGVQYLPAEPRKKRALRRALDAIESDGFIRKIRDDDSLIAYGLVQEELDKKNIDIKLTKLNIIIFDKETSEVQFRGKYMNDEIKRLFERYQEVYTAQDLRSIVLSFVKINNGITLRDTGGIYFLQDPKVVEQLEKFFRLIKSDMFPFPLFDTEQAKKQMFTLVKAELERDVELAAERVKEMTASGKIGGTRSTTFENQLKNFKLMKGKLGAFSDLLKNDVEVIDGKLSELEKEVGEALLGELETYPQKEEFEYQSKVIYTGRASAEDGDPGTVVGYRTTPAGHQFVKVLMERTDEVRTCAVKTLEAID